MTPTQSEGSLALHALSDLAHALLSADTGLHSDGYARGEEAMHRHPLLSGEDRETVQGISSRLDALIEASARPAESFEDTLRKYVGPVTTGEAGLAAQLERCQSARRLGHEAECAGKVDLYYVDYGALPRSEWLCEEHARNLVRVPA